jgi:hypothetical protein
MIEVNDEDEDERLAAAYRLLCARTAHRQDYDNEAAGRSVPCGLSLCCRTLRLWLRRGATLDSSRLLATVVLQFLPQQDHIG